MTTTAKKRSDYKVFPYNVKSLLLDFDLDDNKTIVTSTAYYVAKNTASNEPLTLDGQNMKLLTVYMNGDMIHKDVDYTVTDEGMVIHNPPNRFKLMIKTEIHPETNTMLEGLYRESSDEGSTFCTQCESEGFRKITYYPDRPDVMTKFTVKIEADIKKYPYILSNGNKIKSGDAGNGRHFAIWEDPWKKPAYLFALVAGDLTLVADEYTTIERRKVALEIFVEHHNADKVSHAMASLKKAMKWDEDTFGLAYDLDTYMIVATDSFNMGAMENKGLNVFNTSCILADPATSTDAEFAYVEAVIAHEYFHNWTGNRVTCRDWFQLTLKEGLTVFRDQEFSSDMQSRPVARISEVEVVRNGQFAEDAGPMSHPIRPDEVKEMNNFYTNTVYRKGAEVIRMIHTMLGKDGFRKGMDLYFKRHDGQAVTCEDFINAMADATGVDLTQFFDTWYFQAGTPEVDVSWEYNAVEKTFTLKVKQFCPATPGQSTKQPFHFPLVLSLIDENGNNMVLESDDVAFNASKSFINITKKSQSFKFTNVESNPIPSLFHDFSAPVKVDIPYTMEEQIFLMENDSNVFNRYEAVNKIAVDLIKTMVNSELAGGNMVVGKHIVSAFKQVIADVNSGNLEGSIAAKMLTLPASSYVGGLMPEINIGLLQKARKMIRKEVVSKLESEFTDLYDANKTTADYKFTVEEVSKRALQNVSLSYLMALGNDDSVVRAFSQFGAAHKSGNMTDVMVALSCLVNSASKDSVVMREKALAIFHDCWKDNTEVIGKWLSVQASSTAPNTLNVVKKLLTHSAYNETKPNKVSSVIGGFCASGANNFHNIDGSGYNFIADFIIKYDKINPQKAARLVGPLLDWKRMDSVRGGLMKSAIEKIEASGKLSTDISEKIEKALV